MLNLNLDPFRINDSIINVDFANGKQEYYVKINDAIDAKIRVTHDKIIFNLNVEGWWNNSTQLRYGFQTKWNKDKPTLEFSDVNCSSSGMHNPNCGESCNERVSLALKNKAAAFMAFSLINTMVENNKDIIENKLAERIKIQATEKTIQADNNRSKMLKERLSLQHSKQNPTNTHNILLNGKQSLQALNTIKKDLIASTLQGFNHTVMGKSKEYIALRMKKEMTLDETVIFEEAIKFIVKRVGSKVVFSDDKGKGIGLNTLAALLVNTTIIQTM
ncbi:hypothetical protein [Photobacterium kishitanii]|uniref:Uncharacterized protein n=1 Tax=Photobacterium kishitanii TaxID=318456 RepID=A0A2T3KB02_9GAMM|nr:hypothetical protein [Photobacterium kishitanii]PSU89794.1 hypothetical protein C9J27_24235 [Photobacterium kishitanii]